MYRPPLDPRDRPLNEAPTGGTVVMSYGLMALLPLLVWVVSRPVAGTVTIVSVASLFIGGRRLYRLIRCFYDCEAFSFELRGRARITIAQIPTEEAS